MAFSFPDNQRYSCRDCPARCCRGSLQIAIPEADMARFSADPWIKTHLKSLGVTFEPVKKLPGMYFLPKIYEQDGGLRCAFLENDMLCGIHRRHGHEYLPTICQTFPFRFGARPDGTTTVIASRLCPSIRDNYGDPLDQERLQQKLLQTGQSPEPMATEMEIGTGVLLDSPLYLKLADAWIEELEQAPTTTLALARIYQLTSRLGESFAPETKAEPELFLACLESLRKELGNMDPLPERPGKIPMIAALSLNILSLPLTNPFRSHIKSRGLAARLSLWAGVQGTFLKLMRQRGHVGLQFCPEKADLARAFTLPDGVTPKELGAERRQLLIDVLRRGSLWIGERKHLLDVVFYLILGHSLIRHYSRLVAGAHRAERIELPHVREAVSTAEYVLFFHARYFGANPAGAFLLRTFSSNQMSCWKILSAGQ